MRTIARKFGLLVLITNLFAGMAWAQGTETFDNYSGTGAYVDGTFTGQDASTWTYAQCRGDFEITGSAIMIGRSRTPQSNFYSGTISGGIGVLNFDYSQAFSTNVSMNVLVNDVVVGTVTSSSELGVTKSSGDITVNVAGDFVLKFIGTTTSAGQVVVDNITWTGYSAGSPTITADPTSLTDLSYIYGAGPSTSQSYNLSGTDLTGAPGNIVVTGSTNYEVSTDNSSFSSSVNVAYGSATLSSTPVYIRLKAGLTAGDYNSETISNAGGGATTVNVTCSGTVFKLEPTSHVTSFSASAGIPSYSAITLTWTDASSGTTPDSYLIKGSTVSYGDIAAPVDGTAESDGALVKNITQGTQTATFSSLSDNTAYYFKIYSYTNTGTAVNYKTDGTIPTATQTTTQLPSLPLTDDFEYTASQNLTDNGWYAHSGSGTNPITVSSGGLTYTGHPGSGVGNAALLDNTGEDVQRTFQTISSGTVYASFLVNVTTIATGYFLNFENSGTFGARVFIKDDGSGNVQFGISNTSTATYGLTTFSTGTTYFCVVKYDITTTDANLWVFASGVPGSEGAAGSAEVTATGSGQAAVTSLDLRQYSSSQNLTIDAIRVATSWGDMSLPVELSVWKATSSQGLVKLLWTTDSEIENQGFIIERRGAGKTWSEIASFATNDDLLGQGSTSAQNNYFFIDKQVKVGKTYSYRLSDVDYRGNVTQHAVIDVTVKDAGKDLKPSDIKLHEAFPNPFNPSVNLSFTLEKETSALSLEIYDIQGALVNTLSSGYQDMGTHDFSWDGHDGQGNAVPSGVYLVRLGAGPVVQIQRVTLLR